MEQTSTIKQQENQQTDFIGTLTRCDWRCKEILDDFRLLVTFDESILNSIVECTNQYIDVFIIPEFTRDRDVCSTDIIEILGLLYLAGVYRGSRLYLDDLWDTNREGIETLRLTMSLRRFQFLIRGIRFDNRETRGERRKLDRLSSIRHV
ncbi:hypothetical protein AVEN_8975-1 [Araneus ventricosus]|uniref:PiggyBac transposable element-derived protein domain-containing protein n=1 Tax=Araneus ventricosus TaxID=182803 RepID=A0A4Y2KEM1_ARAVE|nr:hypothetical protein AVEN_8975-1 [Araneus ventricosus]